MEFDIYFEENSARLTRAQQLALENLACHALARGDGDIYPGDGSIVLDGHASRLERSPKSLARRRLEVVRNALLSNGVSGTRIKAASHAADNPVASEEPDTRAKNRRVEISGGRPAYATNCGLWDRNELRQTR